MMNRKNRLYSYFYLFSLFKTIKHHGKFLQKVSNSLIELWTVADESMLQGTTEIYILTPTLEQKGKTPIEHTCIYERKAMQNTF